MPPARALAGWMQAWPTLLLLVALAAQDLVHETAAYRGHLARHRWQRARALLAPTLHERGLGSAAAVATRHGAKVVTYAWLLLALATLHARHVAHVGPPHAHVAARPRCAVDHPASPR